MATNKKPAPGGNRETGSGDASNGSHHIPTNAVFCPKWHKCGAPLCPLDANIFTRVMRNDDPVCYYLTEAAKVDAAAIFRWRGRAELFSVVSALMQPMSSRWGRIRRALERAKSTGSRMATLTPWEVDHVRPD